MKLTYFNGKGLAETSRIILAIVGEPYDDYRYPLEIIDWKTHNMVKKQFDKDKSLGKLTKSLNKVPFLFLDGQVISQSKTIERFLARRHNLMGDNDIEAAIIDSICEWVRDFKDLYQKVRRIEDSDKKETAMNQWFSETLVGKLTLLDNILGTNGFSVGGRMSLADIVLYSFIKDFFDNKESSWSSTSSAPNLRKIVENVSNNKNLQRWLDNRPETAF